MNIYMILFALEALIVLVGFFVGLKRGAAKAAVRFFELLIVAAASFLISKSLMGILSEKALELLHANLDESLKSVLLSAPEAEALVAGLACALILPIVFALVYIVLKPFTLIGLSALARLFTRKKDGKKKRLLGALIGALTSVITAAVVLCPLYTYTKIIATLPEETISSFTEELGAGAITEYFPKEDMTPPVSALAVNLAASFETDGKTYNSTEELPRLADLVIDVMDSYTASKEKGESELLNISAAIGASVDHLKDSEYIATLTTSVLNSIGENIKNGNDIFGLAEGMEGPMADMMLKSIGNILTSVTPENIADNIAAIAGDGENEGMLTVITEITSAGDVQDILNDTEKVDKLANSLINIAENPALSSTMDALTEMGTGMLTEVIPEEGSEKRNEYLGTLSESLNEVLTATKETQGDFETSVNTATPIIQQKIAEASDREISEGEAKLIAICALHNFGTAENYADAENAPVSIEDIENFFKLNK